MDILTQLIFWISTGAIIYTYALYPVVLAGVSMIKQCRSDIRFINQAKNRRINSAQYEYPEVAIIISAYNEQEHIIARLKNLEKMDYPMQKLTIYLGSDGSHDNTVSLVQSYLTDSTLNIKFKDFKINRGKASVLNDLVAATHQDIIVFSDANTEFDPLAIKMLTRRFIDPTVGAVCGELYLIDNNNNQQDGLYWKIERFLKFHESRLGGLLGANGAIYAIRRQLYQPISHDTIVDDFIITMHIAQQGDRLIYDPEAKAYELVAPDIGEEFKRRVRIGIGNYQAFFQLTDFLKIHILNNGGIYFFTYISHKVIRWFTPHCMILALFSNIMLLGHFVYMMTLGVQMVLYLLAGYAYHKPINNKIMAKPLAMLSFLVAMNVAFAKGFIRYILGDYRGSWAPTKRD